MKVHQIESNISNNAYLALLDWAIEDAFAFSLVWRDGFSFGSSAEELENKLRPHLIKEEMTNEWPGTRITSSPTHTIRFYLVLEKTIKLLRAATSAYAWLAPNYPEDLAFYYKNYEPWFGSVAHEQLAFLFGGVSIVATAKKRIPEIVILPGFEWDSDT